MLDAAGPLQAFDEARAYGAAYRIEMCGTARSVRAAQGLESGGLAPLPKLGADDVAIVPGYRLLEVTPPKELVRWVAQVAAAGAQVCSVCTGAFVLGEAGLLDERECTTHWKRVGELQRRFPRARVLEDRLFVTSGNLMTSAGIAAGIDLSLALIEMHHGPRLTAQVAREMVVYLRRDGQRSQESAFLDYRSHLNAGVHDAQDLIASNLARSWTIAELAKKCRMSSRNLTRTFRVATGISVAEFRTRLRLELARTLIQNPNLTLESVAQQCGLRDARQLRRLFKQAFGVSPRNFGA